MVRVPLARYMLEVARERDRQDACSALPGGAENYHFVPARCAPLNREPQPLGNQRQRQRPQRNAGVVDLGRQHMLINRCMPRLIQERQDEMRNLENIAGPVEAGDEHVALADLYSGLLVEQPEFLVRASRFMLDPTAVREYPNVTDRYKALADERSAVFVNSASTQAAVFQLVLNRIEDLES